MLLTYSPGRWKCLLLKKKDEEKRFCGCKNVKNIS